MRFHSARVLSAVLALLALAGCGSDRRPGPPPSADGGGLPTDGGSRTDGGPGPGPSGPVDPACVDVFKKSQTNAYVMMKLSMTELQGHMNKGKWG